MKAFVYRILHFKIHKLFCVLQNNHKAVYVSHSHVCNTKHLRFDID